MIGLVAPIIIAILLALTRGGSFAGWPYQRVAWWPAIPASLITQALIFSPPLDEQPWVIAAGPWLWVASMVVIMVMLMRNALGSTMTRMAWLIAALGVGLNVLVVVANGGAMPRDATASAVAGSPVAATERLTNVAPLTDESQLWWLSDIIPQPDWLPLANVVSAGDLVLAGGVAWWSFQVTMSEPRRRARLPLSTVRVRSPSAHRPYNSLPFQ